MKWKVLAVAAFASMMLVACSGDSTTEENNSKETVAQVGDTQDLKQLVQDYSLRKIETGSASITSKQLIVTDSDANEVVYDLPEDEFFVSIAPYINETHP